MCDTHECVHGKCENRICICEFGYEGVNCGKITGESKLHFIIPIFFIYELKKNFNIKRKTLKTNYQVSNHLATFTNL